MGNFLHRNDQPIEQEDEIVGENVTRFNVDKCKKKTNFFKKTAFETIIFIYV